jgi:hypothetical protein
MVEPCPSSLMPKLGDGTLLHVYVFSASAPPAAAAAELGAPSTAPGLLPGPPSSRCVAAHPPFIDERVERKQMATRCASAVAELLGRCSFRGLGCSVLILSRHISWAGADQAAEYTAGSWNDA